MKKILLTIILILTVIPIVTGVICRQSFSDISKNENPLNEFEVGLLGKSSSEYLEEYFEDNLENDSKYILRVKPQGKMNFLFLCYSEPVEVVKVYKGSGLNIGDKIEIVRNSSTIFWNMNNTDSINTGFVNKMNDDEEYLVFLGDNFIYDKRDFYKTPPALIAPIFSYSSHENMVCNTKNELSSIAYKEINTNEFFVKDEYTLELLLKEKNKLISEYN